MGNRATVRNWADHQHYKHRSPPWIKLHRRLLDDPDWCSLPLAAKALAPQLWLLASENDGEVDCDPSYLSFRLRMGEAEIKKGLIALLSAGWLEDASNMLATCLQGASNMLAQSRERVETERETEESRGETEIHPEFSAAKNGNLWFPEWWAEMRSWYKLTNRRLAYKKQAEETWKKLGCAKHGRQIIDRTRKQREHYADAQRSGQDPPPPQDPHRYLKNRRFNDELP